MKLLMHICCAPCANMPVDALRADGIDLTGYWYNPNIHPFTEYRARRNCLQEYAKTIELPLLVRDDYGLRPFVREVAEDIAGRCVKCYEMRLFEAARAAKEGGFDAFTSSLFISPYQKHELMRDVAYRAAEEYGVTFYYQDFRPMFRDGQTRARELGFRQIPFHKRNNIRHHGNDADLVCKPQRKMRRRLKAAKNRNVYAFSGRLDAGLTKAVNEDGITPFFFRFHTELNNSRCSESFIILIFHRHWANRQLFRIDHGICIQVLADILDHFGCHDITDYWNNILDFDTHVRLLSTVPNVIYTASILICAAA